MLTSDRFSGGILALFALGVIWESRLLPMGTWRAPGPAFVPVLLATLLLSFSVLLIVTSRGPGSLASVRWTGWRHVLAILGSCVFAGLALERLGYRLTVLLVLVYLVGILEKRAWRVTAIFALVLTFGSYFLFYTVLRVPLPQGPLGF
jgi:hypothetical protein